MSGKSIVQRWVWLPATFDQGEFKAAFEARFPGSRVKYPTDLTARTRSVHVYLVVPGEFEEMYDSFMRGYIEEKKRSAA